MKITFGPTGCFNQVAEAFERWRPGYVPELYQDLFAYHSIAPSSRVLEIGIGTGHATLPILATGCSLTAVELGNRLVALVRKKFQGVPNFTVIQADFQKYEAEEGSYDLIYSASAFHWIPEEEGYTRVFRLLKSGGTFARFAHHLFYRKGQEKLFAAIQQVYAAYMPGSAPSPEYREEDAEFRAAIALKYGFTNIAWHLYHQTLTYTAQEYAAMIGTYSDHIALGKEQCQALCNRVGEAIEAFGGRIIVYDTIDLNLASKP